MLFRNCRLITPWDDHPRGWLRIHGAHIAGLGHLRPPDPRPDETPGDEPLLPLEEDFP